VGDVVDGEEYQIVSPVCRGANEVLSSVVGGTFGDQDRHIDGGSHDVGGLQRGKEVRKRMG
jgi:hypothetical protein